jgi:hypothetical protein
MTHEERLAKAIDKLQHERAVLLSKIERLEQRQLDFRPSSHSWSIGQVTHHVGLAEAVWHGYVKSVLKTGTHKREATLRVSLQEIPFSSRVIPDFLWRNPFVLTPLSMMVSLIPRPLQSMLFAVPLFKMDAGPRMQPQYGMTRTQLLKFLDEVRKTTLEILRPVAEWELSRFRISHPLAGQQDIYGILELIASHEQRHAEQIDSIKKRLYFPRKEVATGTS